MPAPHLPISVRRCNSSGPHMDFCPGNKPGRGSGRSHRVAQPCLLKNTEEALDGPVRRRHVIVALWRDRTSRDVWQWQRVGKRAARSPVRATMLCLWQVPHSPSASAAQDHAAIHVPRDSYGDRAGRPHSLGWGEGLHPPNPKGRKPRTLPGATVAVR